VGLWLHGHRHGAYCFSRPGGAPFPVICVGSATQAGYWSYNEYQVEGRQVQVTRRAYDPSAGGFRERETFEVEMTAG
jgi:hypothetical protein